MPKACRVNLTEAVPVGVDEPDALDPAPVAFVTEHDELGVNRGPLNVAVPVAAVHEFARFPGLSVEEFDPGAADGGGEAVSPPVRGPVGEVGFLLRRVRASCTDKGLAVALDAVRQKNGRRCHYPDRHTSLEELL